MRKKYLLVDRPLRREQNNSSRLLHRQHELDVRPVLATLPNQRRSIVESAQQTRAARRHGPAILCLVPGHEVRPVDLQHDAPDSSGARRTLLRVPGEEGGDVLERHGRGVQNGLGARELVGGVVQDADGVERRIVAAEDGAGGAALDFAGVSQGYHHRGVVAGLFGGGAGEGVAELAGEGGEGVGRHLLVGWWVGGWVGGFGDG